MYETRSEQWKKHWRPSLFPSWVCQIEANFTSLCKINKIPIIIPMYFFLIGLKYPEIHLERIRYLWLAIKCRKKCAKGTFGLPDVRGHYKATVIKSTWYQHRLRQMNQCNRLESPGIDIWLWKYTYKRFLIQWQKDDYIINSTDIIYQQKNPRALFYTIHKNKCQVECQSPAEWGGRPWWGQENQQWSRVRY